MPAPRYFGLGPREDRVANLIYSCAAIRDRTCTSVGLAATVDRTLDPHLQLSCLEIKNAPN